ncbi:MAG: dethiobiotin synthase [Mediterraneibacter faecis]|nr:dethiobiotin synthase [Clostridiales bacterium]
MGKGIFVTGTGTDVGKTYVTGLIIKKIKENGMTPGYFKAAMSGNEREEDGTLIPGDALWVKNVSGISQSVEEMCPYVYEHAYSPHLASRLEGNHVEMAVVLDNYRKVKEKYDYITVEGSGGILCPICFDEARIGLTDIIDEMELDCILVADAGLGTINSVVLTYEYMKNRNMNIKGMIFNHYIEDNIMHEDNIRMCEYMTGLPTLAKVSMGDVDLNIDIAELISLYR